MDGWGLEAGAGAGAGGDIEGGKGAEGAGRREEGGKAISLILLIAYFSKKNQDETFLSLGGRVALQAWSTVSLTSVGR